MSKLNYEHDYCHAGMTGMEADTVPEVLGKAEGRDEWEDSHESADANFINIKSYKMFTESDYVFLVGRIGSGKTAMLNKLKYSIDTGKCKTYSCASMIDTENYVGQLGKSIRLSEDSTLSYNEMMILAKNAWRKTINTIAMNAMYEAYSQFGSERFKHIKDYLEEEGILSSHITAADIISKLCDRLSSIDNAYIQGTTAAVSALSSIFHSTEKYNNALVELAKITKRYNKPLILIDSIELYEYSDRIVLAVLNALATVCMESTKKTSCVYIKMAAPSELIPKLIINFEKLTSKTIYIRWSYCDLKEFIAVRIYRYIKKVPSNSPINSQIALDFFY